MIARDLAALIGNGRVLEERLKRHVREHALSSDALLLVVGGEADGAIARALLVGLAEQLVERLEGVMAIA